MAHTPGQWKVWADEGDGTSVCIDGGKFGHICIAKAYRPKIDEPEIDDVANARLIAAAPRLLKLAKRARNILRYLHGLEIANRDCVWGADYTDEINDLDAAIAEAEGRDG